MKQQIFKVRRSYNQWVNNQTLEDYALRFTARGSRKWSLSRVANTALGAISFLALEAIGATITLSYGFENAAWAILIVGAIIFFAGLPICYHAARYGVDIDLLTRGAGFGYIGSTITSLIYASFTFIFFALEAAIMAKALEILFGLPLALGYITSSLVIIPMVFHGITFISRFQLWTQPIWVVLQILPLLAILIHDFQTVKDWTAYTGTQQEAGVGFSLILFGTAASVMFSLVAQIGEQVDFLRFMPEKQQNNRLAWWTALVLGGPGWVLIGVAKLFIGSLLAYIAIRAGVDAQTASDPTEMYAIAFSYLNLSPNAALIIAGVFVILSQMKINVTNAYAGSIAWSNFFSRLTHSHPGRVVWLVFNVSIALLLMELGVYQAFEETLGVYAIVAVAWVGALVSDLSINKPLKLSPNYIEFKRAYLYDINPVGVGAMLVASLVGFLAYLGLWGDTVQALSHFFALGTAFVLVPCIALLTKSRFYIARPNTLIQSDHTQTLKCTVCENPFEMADMADCPAYGGCICSLCCSLDSRCMDRCKPSNSLHNVWLERFISKRTLHFLVLLALISLVTAVLLSLMYSDHQTNDNMINALLSGLLWKVFFILLIVAGVISWLFVLTHESRQVAQEESNRQNMLLQEEIEAHKATDAQLQEAKEQAEAANNAKSRYLTGISHELRTPLNTIQGYMQLMALDKGIPEANKHQIKIVRNASDHLTDLIEGLLDISKIEAGRLEIQRNVIDFPALLEGLRDMFQIQADEKSLVFTYEKGSALPKYVYGDEKRLRQIIINLLSNAVKYTLEGSIHFSVKYRNSVALLEVSDTGIGIPERESNRIFRPFERILHPNCPSTNGSGLGLTITKFLVDIMGGDIKVDSQVGNGSTFTVLLQLPICHEPQQKSDQLAHIFGYRGKRLTLLLVDDEAAHRGLMREWLDSLGFVIVEAHDADSCLDIVTNFTPDAFLIDRKMPQMQGTELAKVLRNRGFRQPIFIISANAKEDTHSGPEEGEARKHYDEYLIKPLQLPQLLEKLGTHLDIEWLSEPFSESNNNAQNNTADMDDLDDIIEELIGWAEVGAATRVKRILDQLEAEKRLPEATLMQAKAYYEKMAFHQFSQLFQSRPGQ